MLFFLRIYNLFIFVSDLCVFARMHAHMPKLTGLELRVQSSGVDLRSSGAAPPDQTHLTHLASSVDSC